MKKIVILLLVAGCVLTKLVAQQVAVGMTEDDLLKANGSPQSKAKMGKKSIYRWPSFQVTLVDGKVESFKLRDLAAEKEAAAERSRLERLAKAEAKAKARETIQNAREQTTYSRLEANAANRDKEEQLRRAATISQTIRSIEEQLAEDSKRSAFSNGPKPMTAEARAYLNLRLDNLKAELANFR